MGILHMGSVHGSVDLIHMYVDMGSVDLNPQSTKVLRVKLHDRKTMCIIQK